jgi:hypothetical protein
MENHSRKYRILRNLATYTLLGLAILPAPDYRCNGHNRTPASNSANSRPNLETKVEPDNSNHQNSNVLANYQPSLEKFLENTRLFWEGSQEQRAIYEQYFNSLDLNEQKVVGAFTSEKDFKKYEENILESEKKAVEDYARSLSAKNIAEYHSICPLIPRVKSPKYLTKPQKYIIYGLKVNKDIDFNSVNN